ncbi:MAG TPA: hypothetical protein VFT29_08685 [Gemmatimonadaceae bacterium]|nr:hypothetical protein [Gemmatimonadaceae bacterium]
MFLTAHGDVVGELGPEYPLGASDMHAWPLLPTAGFEKVRGVVGRCADAAQTPVALKLPAEIRDIPDIAERAQAIQAWLRANPDAQRHISRCSELQQAEFAITDDHGATLPTRALAIMEMPSPDIPPFYLVTAVLPSRAAR